MDRKAVIATDKVQAERILIANAVCVTDKELSCYDCPIFEEQRTNKEQRKKCNEEYTPELTIEAVRTLNKLIQENEKETTRDNKEV